MSDPSAIRIILADDHPVVREGVAAMANLLKDTPRQELPETIRTVADGKKRISSNVAGKLTDRMMNPSLTERKLDVLRPIAAGLSNRNIGSQLTITEETVKTHVNSLLNKVDVQDLTQAVTKALRRGILHLD